jgi:hypothetical protein
MSVAAKTYDLKDLTIVAASSEQARVGRQNTFRELATFLSRSCRLCRTLSRLNELPFPTSVAYWGAPRGFTMEKYLERDEIMEKEEWGADHHLITW